MIHTIYAHPDRPTDDFYRLKNGWPAREHRPGWRMVRVVRRLTRDRIMCGKQLEVIWEKMCDRWSRYPHGSYYRFIPFELAGFMHGYVYKGQTLTDTDTDKFLRFVKSPEFTSPRNSETGKVFLDGKRVATKRRYNARCDQVYQIKALAIEIERAMKYAKSDKFAPQHIRFAETPRRYPRRLQVEQAVGCRRSNGC